MYVYAYRCMHVYMYMFSLFRESGDQMSVSKKETADSALVSLLGSGVPSRASAPTPTNARSAAPSQANTQVSLKEGSTDDATQAAVTSQENKLDTASTDGAKEAGGETSMTSAVSASAAESATSTAAARSGSAAVSQDGTAAAVGSASAQSLASVQKSVSKLSSLTRTTEPGSSAADLSLDSGMPPSRRSSSGVSSVLSVFAGGRRMEALLQALRFERKSGGVLRKNIELANNKVGHAKIP